MKRLFIAILAAAVALPAIAADESAPPAVPFQSAVTFQSASAAAPSEAPAVAPPEAPAAPAEPMPPLTDYAGAEGCKGCHKDKYSGWKRTFHSTVVQDAKARPDAVLGDFSQPGIGFSRDEVEFTVGGHWNQRYMKKIGDDYYVLPKSWSISSRRWENYNVWGWKKMPYSKFCQGCHVTRYDPTDGSLVEHTIGCESCHG
ncbi:MAG TPA: multiheme c-type cytochrome, partial [Geobacteraceae bacterium]